MKALKRQNTLWSSEARTLLIKDKVKICKKDCLKAKKPDWRNFNTKQNSTESINILQKILERKKENTLGVLEKPDGTSTNPGQDTIEFLMKSHFPSITATKPIEHKNTKIRTADINKSEIDGFDKDILNEVIQTFKNKKAAGPDGLKPLFLKELPRNKLEELLFIYK